MNSSSQTRWVDTKHQGKSHPNLHILVVAGVRHGLDLNSDFLWFLASLQLNNGPFNAVLDVDEGPAVNLALGGGIVWAHGPDALPDPVGGLSYPAAHSDGVVEHRGEGQPPTGRMSRAWRQLENDTWEKKGKRFSFGADSSGAAHTDTEELLSFTRLPHSFSIQNIFPDYSIYKTYDRMEDREENCHYGKGQILPGFEVPREAEVSIYSSIMRYKTKQVIGFMSKS